MRHLRGQLREARTQERSAASERDLRQSARETETYHQRAPTAANSGWRGSNLSGAADRNGGGPSKVEEPVSTGSGVPASGENGVGTVERAAVGLAKAGLAFLQSIAAELESRSAHTAGPQGQGALSSLFSRHPQTNHPMLSIPLPESFTAERMTQAVAQFLSALEVPAK
jgi:hypothetical protein